MEDDPQAMMNNAKNNVIMATLKAGGNEATFKVLFEAAEAAHCDVLTAALHSMKRKKIVAYDPDSEMPLLNPKDDAVVVRLLKPDFVAA